MSHAPRQKYTLGFIRSGDQVLFLNRQKAPWMGRWNGVGGKLDQDESPHECIVREAFEETGLSVPQFDDRGVMYWYTDGESHGGVHIFTAEISQEQMENYKTPRRHCHEGILDWKSMDWLLHEENTGVVDNVKIMLKDAFAAGPQAVWVSSYVKKQLQSCTYDAGKQ